MAFPSLRSLRPQRRRASPPGSVDRVMIFMRQRLGGRVAIAAVAIATVAIVAVAIVAVAIVAVAIVAVAIVAVVGASRRVVRIALFARCHRGRNLPLALQQLNESARRAAQL